MAPMMLGPNADRVPPTPLELEGPGQGQKEPIAICGLVAFWDLISKGRSSKGDVPGSRFNIGGFYHPNGTERPGSMAMNGGYFIQDEIRGFENNLFGINNLEATYMDPQQRKLLEVVFECFENAGIPLEKVSGSNTGCYVGNFTFDFQVMQLKEPDYLVLDTACSSSLYCLHVACTALENYDCDAAIVAGANLIQSAEQHIATMKAGVLSPTSECHTFDISADGYGRADGIGALYVKRLADALQDGDPIRSVIRSSAINANGRTTGISLPSADGQEMVIRKALSKGKIEQDDVTYVECHGTGTKVGDAIEIEALSRVFRRTVQDPLFVGSVKSNLGHSEAASGISSIIKATMAMERGQIPPTYGLRNVNPKLNVDEHHICIPIKLMPWPERPCRLRRVGVSSFGYGGANAHVILEEAPKIVDSFFQQNAKNSAVLQSSVVLPLSAATKTSLEARVADFAAFNFGDTDILDLTYTLGSKRTNFPTRGFLIAPRSWNIAQSFAQKPFITSGCPASNEPAPLVFVFTGQGSQWAGMCSELFTEFPVFRNAIAEMEAVLSRIPYGPDWSLREAILDLKNPDLVHLPERSQPCCTAIQIALTRLLESWDILPDVTVGHSSGEIAAAFAAGHITTAEAIVIAYYRGYCVSKSGQLGAMMAVGISESAAVEHISDQALHGQLKLACVNSPENVTISGECSAIAELLTMLQQKGIFARKLKTGGQAYHSHHMSASSSEYQLLLDRVLPTLGPSSRLSGSTTFMSSVTGEAKSSHFTSGYWINNLESQVRFAQAIQNILNQSNHDFIELGPHSALELPIKQTATKVRHESQVRYSAVVRRKENSLETTLRLAGTLWIHGHSINWSKVNGLQTPTKTHKMLYNVVRDLPPYRFVYESMLWNECRASIEYRQRRYPRHELLGSLMPGGNGRDLIFRNVLRVADIPWLVDHKLGDTVVFPGAAYLATAVEAVSQATGLYRPVQPSFHFYNVNITNALVLSTDQSAQVEMLTSLRKSAITKAVDSSTLWDFTISTFQENATVQHASGALALNHDSVVMEPRCQASPSDYLEATAKRTWYSRFAKQGLNYGSSFQIISECLTPRMKSTPFASAKAPLLHRYREASDVYPVHPITLDAMVQLSIVATANGIPNELRAQVPTRITSMRLNASSCSPGEKCQINARVQSTGFESYEAVAELVTPEGEVVVQLDKLRLSVYHARAQGDLEDRRHPVLRVLWKPDVYGLGFMASQDATNYLQKFADEADSPVLDDSLLKLGAMIDLLVHKNARLRMLEVGNDDQDFTMALLDFLSSRGDYKRLSSYSYGSVAENGAILGGSVDLESRERCINVTSLRNASFDLIIVPKMGPCLESHFEDVKSLLTEEGTIVAIYPRPSITSLSASGLSYLLCPVSQGQATLLVARQTPTSNVNSLKGQQFLIVEMEESELGTALVGYLRAMRGCLVKRVKLHELTAEHISAKTTVFNLCELKSPILCRVSDEDMQRIKIMTDRAASLVWVTGGDMMRGTRPEFSLVSGLSRALVLEQPSLRFYTYDIDDPDKDVHATADRLTSVLNQPGPKSDLEFIQRQGIVHVSRLTPDDGLNAAFRIKQGLESTTMKLKDAGAIRLAIGQVGQFDTIFFRQQEASTPLLPDQVRIKVASIGLNAKDFYVLAGRVDSANATCQLECAGTVEQVGIGVADFAIGDRVVAMAPTHIQSYQVLPFWACHKLEDKESFNVCASLPLAHATAIYALYYRANIQPGETVLIHSGAGGVGMAAIQVAQGVGAKIFTTVSTEEKRKYLIERFSIRPSNIFSSRDTSFLDGILKATGGRGVDVILNSLTGDQLHATWRCAAPFGRFVEIGKMDLSTGGRLEMDQFLRNTTFTAFDLSSLYSATNKKHHGLWTKLLSDVMTLYRAGKLAKADPPEVFDIAEVAQALRRFSSRNRIGGLGRTLARWMVQRGARKFAFLGRSGLDKPAARILIQDLEACGAKCAVVRGDVCNTEDVAAVIAAAQGEIGGIMQAAMGLNESLFSSMPNEYWHTGIDPKVWGTWHLYNHLQSSGRHGNLNFFLMTSSVSGSVGTATESNYCAANYFLDNFARHLRSQGVPAVSVGLGMISEVGYLHENPEIEALLLRKGIQAIDSDELLQIVDLALSSSSSMGIHHAHDTLAAGHLLTGLEASGLKELRKKGFDGTNPTWDDPRATLLANSLDGGPVTQQAAQAGNLPVGVVRGLDVGQPLTEAVLEHITRRFGNLVLMKYEAVDVKKPLAGYGMDSMLAAEFRTWFYQDFRVDVPMLVLLKPGKEGGPR
ncbi:hypothetical protein DL770_009733 [Monosporascus sp. CRB-9-2]|nr:hypothetical protein DL770_009733 [Monosporascus sp. CRB-9-2]